MSERRMGLYVLVDREPVPEEDIEKWGRFIEDIAGRRVAYDELAGVPPVTVSTVFLGVDNGFTRPLFFETMIFGGEHDGYQSRYETWEEAESGHAKALELVRS